jgi:hypothetical protein
MQRWGERIDFWREGMILASLSALVAAGFGYSNCP